MNIALIVRKYQTSGGTERFTYNLSKFLSKNGHNVTIFCSKSNIIPPENVKIKRAFSIPINRVIKTATFTYSIYKKDFSKFDIVQGCGKIIKQDIYRAGGGFHKLYLKEINREKLTFYDRMVISLEKKLYNTKNTKFVIAVSNLIKKEIIKEFGYPSERIVVFHNPVDLNQFSPVSRENNLNKDLKLLFVANNFKLKGLNSILNVLKQLDNFKLFIVGGDNFENLKHGKIPEKLFKNIFFLGEKRGKELVKIYQQSDLLLHPTYFDPFANVCLEAMACGVPVVTTKINGASEIIENYENGIVIEHAEDYNGLFNAVKKCIENRELLLKMRENCLKKIKEYSFEKYCKRLIDFYQEVKKFKKSIE